MDSLIYRIRLNATPGFYFSFLVCGWGSIQISTTWGCIQGGVLLTISIQSELNEANHILLKNLNINDWHFYLMKYSSRCSFIASIHVSNLFVHFMIPEMLQLTWVGLYSRWGSVVSKSSFDWGCISFWKGWGSIQEWGCIQADTVNILFFNKFLRDSCVNSTSNQVSYLKREKNTTYCP